MSSHLKMRVRYNPDHQEWEGEVYDSRTGEVVHRAFGAHTRTEAVEQTRVQRDRLLRRAEPTPHTDWQEIT